MTKQTHAHLIGICGTAMASLAGMLKQRGYRVTGSDAAAYPPMSDFLASLGIAVTQPFSEQNLEPLPDIVGAADFNGDGKTDLLAQTASGQLDFLFVTGANLTGSFLTSDSYFKVRDASNYGSPGQSEIVTQDPATAQMDFLNFSGTNLVSSNLVDQTDMAPLPTVPGSALAAQLFHVG